MKDFEAKTLVGVRVGDSSVVPVRFSGTELDRLGVSSAASTVASASSSSSSLTDA